MFHPKPLMKLIEEFNKMPGIGPKYAQRLAFYILQSDDDEIEKLILAIKEVKDKISFCPVCFNITDIKPCSICDDEKRDRTIICAVEEVKDLIAIERSREYKGLYHVLGGAINPIDGVNPDDLKIDDLLNRLKPGNIFEVIIATNPTVEGEATAIYLVKLIKPYVKKVTRLGFGLPVGGNIDYADEVTLSRAIEGRRDIG